MFGDDDDDRAPARRAHSSQKSHKSHKRSHNRSHSHKRQRNEEERTPLLQRASSSQAEPWRAMEFELIDCINGYGNDQPDSRPLRGEARPTTSSCVGRVVDMTDFARLEVYLRESFEVDPEISIVLRVPVCI